MSVTSCRNNYKMIREISVNKIIFQLTWTSPKYPLPIWVLTSKSSTPTRSCFVSRIIGRSKSQNKQNKHPVNFEKVNKTYIYLWSLECVCFSFWLHPCCIHRKARKARPKAHHGWFRCIFPFVELVMLQGAPILMSLNALCVHWLLNFHSFCKLWLTKHAIN